MLTQASGKENIYKSVVHVSHLGVECLELAVHGLRHVEHPKARHHDPPQLADSLCTGNRRVGGPQETLRLDQGVVVASDHQSGDRHGVHVLD